MLNLVEMGLETEERSIDRSEVYVCEEAFLTGTGVQVAAIVKVEDATRMLSAYNAKVYSAIRK